MGRHEVGATTRLRAWVPRWWRGEGGALGTLLDMALWPAERLFRLSVGVRNLAYDRGWLSAAPPVIPVISVGNLAVGGAGKTPVAAWIAARLAAWGERPAVVLRGYGADEVAVHRELNPSVPVIAAPARAQGVTRAAAEGATVAVLDDAFQHRALARSLDVVLVAAESWDPRPRLLPRGPWRETPDALRRAGLVVVTRKSAPPARAAAVARELGRWAPDQGIAVCALLPERLSPLHAPDSPLPLAWLQHRTVLAVTSLADPQPLLRQLRDLGAAVEALSYPDHHEFAPGDCEVIRAAAAGRALVVTRKEAVKLRPLLSAGMEAVVLEQRLVVESGGEALDAALRRALQP